MGWHPHVWPRQWYEPPPGLDPAAVGVEEDDGAFLDSVLRPIAQLFPGGEVGLDAHRTTVAIDPLHHRLAAPGEDEGDGWARSHQVSATHDAQTICVASIRRIRTPAAPRALVGQRRPRPTRPLSEQPVGVAVFGHEQHSYD